jgi:Ran GTPase-activating protein (RanGAP) involved in mRNA processing and transport
VLTERVGEYDIPRVKNFHTVNIRHSKKQISTLLDTVFRRANSDNGSVNIICFQYNMSICEVGSLAKALILNQPIEYLQLVRNNLQSCGTLVLAEALRLNQTVKTLDLDMNNMGDDGAIALADALRENKSIKDLSLRSNGISTTGLNAILDAIQDNTAMETIDFSSNPEIKFEVNDDFNQPLDSIHSARSLQSVRFNNITLCKPPKTNHQDDSKND